MILDPANIHQADINANPGLVAQYARHDDIVSDIVTVRRRQDQAVADLGLKAPPSLPRLREANAVRNEFAELFQDLQIEPPLARTDGNAVAERIAHLELLQHYCPQWAKAKLSAIAQADTAGFERIENDIVTAAKRIAADPIIGSFRRPNALRAITRTDAAGHKTVKWCGDPASWMSLFYSPTQTVLRAVSRGYGEWLPGPPP
jgi:hypothetical protein